MVKPRPASWSRRDTVFLILNLVGVSLGTIGTLTGLFGRERVLQVLRLADPGPYVAASTELDGLLVDPVVKEALGKRAREGATWIPFNQHREYLMRGCTNILSKDGRLIVVIAPGNNGVSALIRHFLVRCK